MSADGPNDYQPSADLRSFPTGEKLEKAPLGMGDGGGAGMTPWQQTVENRLAGLRDEIRNLLNLGLAAAGALFFAAVILTGWISNRIEQQSDLIRTQTSKISDQSATIAERLSRLEGRLEQQNQREDKPR